MLYEQSLLTNKDEEGGGDDGSSNSKRARVEEDSTTGAAAGVTAGGTDVGGDGDCSSIQTSVLLLVDEGEFAAMAKRMEEADAAREAVIKGCRDGQKLSKLAIYSVRPT